MAKIQDLSLLEKPREKAIRFGVEKLKDEELLALIINVGTVGHSSLEIAKDIMNDVRSFDVLLGKPVEYYYSFRGLNKVNSLKLASLFEIVKRVGQKQHLIYEQGSGVTSESLYQRYSLSMAGLTQEHFVLVILNKNKQIIFETTLYKGNDVCAVVSTREILRLLSIHNGYYFYMIHNHPNNTLEPSRSDVEFTENIKDKSTKIGAKLLDHLIITSNDYYSFLHERLIEK